MNPRLMSCLLAILCTAGMPLTSMTAAQPDGLEFEITFDKALRGEPFTGRVLIFLSEKRFSEPRLEYSWFDPQPFFSTDVRDWPPDTPLHVPSPRGYPYDLKDIPRKKYRIQAVMHTNPDQPHSGTAPGNLYSKPIRRLLDPEAGGSIKIHIDQRIKSPRRPLPTRRAKLVEFHSPLLSAFHGRDITIRAIVVPTDDYDAQPDRRFPALYVVPGFGGDHYESASYSLMLGVSDVPFVRIGLDATATWGHHVFADSQVNGPWGRALVEEFIPHLEGRFRLLAEPRARFLTGHSSGGWSSLWLQVDHPDFFGGVWSTAPDPVDFHDFCGINLYDKRANFFVDAVGQDRPLIRFRPAVVMTTRDFARMEDTLGPGGQLSSFEAVFGPRTADGSPRPLFDRQTGKTDRQVFKAWKQYDIRRKVQREWKTLGPKLRGKLTIICGEDDNFYLAGAVRRLKKTLERLDSDARVILVPERDHFSLLFSEPMRGMIKDMGRKFQESEPRTSPRPCTGTTVDRRPTPL